MGRIPRWHKGRKRYEHYSGAEYGEREGKLFIREGKLVDKANYDTLTDKERAENIEAMLQRERRHEDFLDIT